MKANRFFDSINAITFLQERVVFENVELEAAEEGFKLSFPKPVFIGKNNPVVVEHDPDTNVLTVEVYTWRELRTIEIVYPEVTRQAGGEQSE